MTITMARIAVHATSCLDVVAPASLESAMPSRLLAIVALACAACGPDGPGGPDLGTPDAALDANVPGIDGPPAQCYDEPTDVNVALQIQIEESCAIWNSLAQLAGHARVSRTGMNLTIDFDNGVVFAGTLVNNAVSLVYEHQHTFTDNCGWKARETLAGALDPATCNFTLSYDYVESVVINNGGCATPCSAQADVDLQLTPIP